MSALHICTSIVSTGLRAGGLLVLVLINNSPGERR